MAEEKTSRERSCLTAKKLMVVAIDFGTTYSGWAYSFESDYKERPTKSFCKNWNSGKHYSSKAPTVVLVNPDGRSLKAFGYEAEDQYATLVEEGEYRKYFYFQHFKMMLYDNKVLNRHTLLEDDKEKKLPAQLVFGLAIRYLREDVLHEVSRKLATMLDEDEIQWVLTVPAIWNIRAKQFMRECAVQAGIKSANLLIALEPEAASLYCKHVVIQKQLESDEVILAAFQPGAKYMVIDAGGGTVDIVVHEVASDGKLEEIYAANGGNWGGRSVDMAFFAFLASVVGEDVITKLKEEHMDDYLDIQREFDVKKQNIKSSQTENIKIRIPKALSEIFKSVSGKTIRDRVQEIPSLNGKVKFVGDKILIDCAVIQACFGQSIYAIVNHVKNIFRDEKTQGVGYVLMVGGYAESAILFETVRSIFSDKKVIVPEEAGLSVLKGAVIFGHTKTEIGARVSQYTYGFAMCIDYNERVHPRDRMIIVGGRNRVKNVFKVLVHRGQRLYPQAFSDSESVEPLEGRAGFSLELFAAEKEKPTFVDETGCFLLGKVYVDCRDNKGSIGGCNVYLTFGETEFEAKAVHETTGKITKVSCDFLD